MPKLKESFKLKDGFKLKTSEKENKKDSSKEERKNKLLELIKRIKKAKNSNFTRNV